MPTAYNVIKTFGTTGLWIRTIQITKADYLTKYGKTFDANETSVVGAYADCWSFAHSSIAQSYFQVAPKEGMEGKRAAALIVDWTQTTEHYVAYSLKDASSNKQFVQGTTTKPSQCRTAMAEMLKELGGTKIDTSEVQSCEFNKASLVGLLWGPIKMPTALSEAGAEWHTARQAFATFVGKLQRAGMATAGLPVFVYQNGSASQTLEYIDFVP